MEIATTTTSDTIFANVAAIATIDATTTNVASAYTFTTTAIAFASAFTTTTSITTHHHRLKGICVDLRDVFRRPSIRILAKLWRPEKKILTSTPHSVSRKSERKQGTRAPSLRDRKYILLIDNRRQVITDRI
ncbi:hypothetical protein L6452_36397 [Arctium lappa]|uniref:Uncharacterized protein n=1 Tax=Arctium lappa TaxID=4217 RepID=A0ACB8Y8D4_ARCLA|nr:hypothetical protein L6452_36397 [Arctium lappa]